jgi:hypothetical protein
MPVMTRQPGQRPPQPPAYEIVLAFGNGTDPRLRVFAEDADRATVSFHSILAGLRRRQQRGELRLCDLRGEGRVILRVPVVDDETSR